MGFQINILKISYMDLVLQEAWDIYINFLTKWNYIHRRESMSENDSLKYVENESNFD